MLVLKGFVVPCLVLQIHYTLLPRLVQLSVGQTVGESSNAKVRVGLNSACLTPLGLWWET